MMRALGAVLFLGLWVCGLGTARADGDIPVSVAHNPNYANAREQMQALVNMFGFHDINEFCIVGYADPGKPNDVWAYVYWPTQNKLSEWNSADGDGNLNMGGIAGERDYVDLRKLMPNGSPGTMSPLPDWQPYMVAGIAADCGTHGDSYTIKKTYGGWISIYKLPQFQTVKAQLQYIVDDQGKQNGNKFCVLGQTDGAYSGAYVYWKTRKRLFFWIPDRNDSINDFAVDMSAYEIDLRTGLRDQEDRASNRNEMQRSYAMLVIRQCVKFGNEIDVQKSGREVIHNESEQ